MNETVTVLLDAMPYVLQGAAVTVIAVVGAMFLGLFIGVPLAVLAGMAPLFGLLTHPGHAHALAAICPAYAVIAILGKPRVLRIASDGFMAVFVALAVLERLG